MQVTGRLGLDALPSIWTECHPRNRSWAPLLASALLAKPAMWGGVQKRQGGFLDNTWDIYQMYSAMMLPFWSRLRNFWSCIVCEHNWHIQLNVLALPTFPAFEVKEADAACGNIVNKLPWWAVAVPQDQVTHHCPGCECQSTDPRLRSSSAAGVGIGSFLWSTRRRSQRGAQRFGLKFARIRGGRGL